MPTVSGGEASWLRCTYDVNRSSDPINKIYFPCGVEFGCFGQACCRNPCLPSPAHLGTIESMVKVPGQTCNISLIRRHGWLSLI